MADLNSVCGLDVNAKLGKMGSESMGGLFSFNIFL